MLTSFYTGMSGVSANSQAINVIGNNLANINTTGYKKENVFIQLMKDFGLNMAKGNGELAGLDVKEYTEYANPLFSLISRNRRELTPAPSIVFSTKKA